MEADETTKAARYVLSALDAFVPPKIREELGIDPVDLGGSGSVDYLGDPEVTQDISGSGTVEPGQTNRDLSSA